MRSHSGALKQRRLERAADVVRAAARAASFGRLHRVSSTLIEASIPDGHIGDRVEIDGPGGRLAAEVVGFRDGLALAVPLGDVRGLTVGARVRHAGRGAEIEVSEAMLGRTVDAVGRPLDGGAAIVGGERVSVEGRPARTARARVERRFDTGVRVIDGLLTLGRGQRVGIFAGAGVGKTVLIRQILRQSIADVTVIGLIGERGCEVHDLVSTEGRERAVVVAATSDRPPLERVRGAQAATAIAEYFRDRGASVLLVVDSLTRYAMALREVGLAAGELPATKGYPASVFAAMPRLLERVFPLDGDGAGAGSITGVYTVLVEGDDLADPVADSARSLLDGHLVLSRAMAARGHFPAIDVLASASRVSRQVCTPHAQATADRVRALLAHRREAEELRSVGAYTAGSDPDLDEALALGPALDRWMRQRTDERSNYEATLAGLTRVAARDGAVR